MFPGKCINPAHWNIPITPDDYTQFDKPVASPLLIINLLCKIQEPVMHIISVSWLNDSNPNISEVYAGKIFCLQLSKLFMHTVKQLFSWLKNHCYANNEIKQYIMLFHHNFYIVSVIE